MLTEAGGAPVGRALTPEEQKRLFEAAASNPEWEHVYCAAVLAANTSMRGVEVKHVRRRDIDLEKVWDVESATGKGVLYVSRSKNETSKRPIPLNQAARDAVERMLKRADDLGHTDPDALCLVREPAPQVRPDEARAASGTAPGASLRKAAGLPGFRFHDLRHTVVTDLLEAGEPDHVIEAVTGHLSRRCWSTTRTSGSRPRARCSRGWKSSRRAPNCSNRGNQSKDRHGYANESGHRGHVDRLSKNARGADHGALFARTPIADGSDRIKSTMAISRK